MYCTIYNHVKYGSYSQFLIIWTFKGKKNSLSYQEFDFSKIVKGSSYQDSTKVKLFLQ